MPVPKATAPNFALVAPTGEQIDRQRTIAAQAQTFANTLVDSCPPGEALDTAIQSLQNSVLWANQAIIYAMQSGHAG